MLYKIEYFKYFLNIIFIFKNRDIYVIFIIIFINIFLLLENLIDDPKILLNYTLKKV